MRLTCLHIKNFRCFSHLKLDLKKSIILIEGINGSGKTSLLEAIHYLCYLRSFRTYSPNDLIQFGEKSFFIKAEFECVEANNSVINNEIQVGFANKKRLVKINKKPISSYKELMAHYRIVTLTEDDLALIKGGPEVRRTFLDQVILLSDPGYGQAVKKLKQIVEQRNSLLKQGILQKESYALWTEQLWETSQVIKIKRNTILKKLQKQVQTMLATYFDQSISVEFIYRPKKMPLDSTFESFKFGLKELQEQELRFRRSLFGAHLDDFSINFAQKKSKLYASRGQQKLIIVLTKAAQLKMLMDQKGPAIFLLDDFMTDFDENWASILLNVLKDLCSQIVFTSPTKGGLLEEKLIELGAQKVLLTD